MWPFGWFLFWLVSAPVGQLESVSSIDTNLVDDFDTTGVFANIPIQEQWEPSVNGLAGLSLLIMLLFVVLIASAYHISAKKFYIRSPETPFQSYYPIKWLWLALINGLLCGATSYAKLSDFNLSQSFIITNSAGVALWTIFWCFVITYCLICWKWIKITPPKYMYHPDYVFWPYRKTTQGAKR